MLILHLFLKNVLEDQKKITARFVYFQSSLKYFKNLLSKHIIIYMDKFLSKYQRGSTVKKGYNEQHCFLAMIQK